MQDMNSSKENLTIIHLKRGEKIDVSVKSKLKDSMFPENLIKNKRKVKDDSSIIIFHFEKSLFLLSLPLSLLLCRLRTPEEKKQNSDFSFLSLCSSPRDASDAFNNSLISRTSSFSASSTPISTTFNSSIVNPTMSLSKKLQLAYYITIALTGLVGNTTTIIVFSQRRLRSLRSSFFLTCLAITDLIFILILVIALLDEIDVPIMTTPVCMLTIYLSHIASFLSSNFTLAYTSHRLIAVFFPIRATTFLKQRTNRILALALLIFACSFYSLSFPVTSTKFRSNDTNIVDCQEDQDKPILFPFLILDTLFTFIIPFSSISCMNLAIVYKLNSKFTYNPPPPTVSNISTPILCPSAKTSSNSSGHSVTESHPLAQLNGSNLNLTSNSNTNLNSTCETNHFLKQLDNPFLTVRPTERYKRARNLHSTSPRHIPLYHNNANNNNNNPNTSIQIRSTQCRATASAKTTKMLLAASTVFLVFNLPYHLLLFCFLFIKEQPSWMMNALNIARLWFFASFCVNFFVYAICGQRFRHEVVRLFNCSSLRRYLTFRHQKPLHDRQNSMYFSHRLLPVSLTHLSQTN